MPHCGPVCHDTFLELSALIHGLFLAIIFEIVSVNSCDQVLEDLWVKIYWLCVEVSHPVMWSKAVVDTAIGVQKEVAGKFQTPRFLQTNFLNNDPKWQGPKTAPTGIHADAKQFGAYHLCPGSTSIACDSMGRRWSHISVQCFTIRWPSHKSKLILTFSSLCRTFCIKGH